MVSLPFFNKAAKIEGPELDRLLVLAAQEGDMKKIKTLIKAGADIDGHDVSEDTPLIGAAREQQLEVVKFLLKEGADRTKVNGFGKTALIVALSEHAPDPLILALITKGGEELSAIDMHGNPAAYYAAQYNHPEVLEALANAGADMAQAGKYGTTPLMRAIELDHADVGRVLLADTLVPKIGLDKQNDEGASVLAVAVENRRTVSALSLIALGANGDLKDKKGRTPLNIAEETGQTELVRALQEQHDKKYDTAAPVRTMRTIALKSAVTP